MAPTSSSHGTSAAASGSHDLRSVMEPLAPQGLYVHFPFCVSLCPYCDFVVVAGGAARGPANRIGALLEAVHAELALRAAGLATKAPLRSVYLGGGTPSLMTADQVGRLLDGVAEALGIASDAEVTLEANPGADEIGDLAGFRAAGVNRCLLYTSDAADERG